MGKCAHTQAGRAEPRALCQGPVPWASLPRGRRGGGGASGCHTLRWPRPQEPGWGAGRWRPLVPAPDGAERPPGALSRAGLRKHLLPGPGAALSLPQVASLFTGLLPWSQRHCPRPLLPFPVTAPRAAHSSWALPGSCSSTPSPPDPPPSSHP